MRFFRITAILFFCVLTTGLSAQKGLIKKANKLYKLNQYNGAIELYEQALQEGDNLSASTKLANCYRMTNQTVKAEAWYEKVVVNAKAKPITYFYYAEALMGNGKYDLAKNWFLKYHEKEPENQDAVRMAYACDKIKTLEPYFPNVELNTFPHNSEADDASPLAINDGIVFTSDRPQGGINPLKQKSGWTGRDYQRIYFSKLNSDGSFDKPGNFSKKLNEINRHCGPVSFTKDKKTIIFSRTGLTPGKNNTYNIQLYSAASEDGLKWKKVKILSFCREDKNYMHPAISPDGSKLFFVSDKSGGLGGTDIYMAEKKGENWGRPKNLGPVINTPSNEAFPYFHESGKLFFSSKGHLSFGGYDILFSNLKEDNSWQKPVNIGKPINSSHDDISIYLNEDSESGFFASSREGGDDDIYLFKILEGINADLESTDFEDIANEGPELEGIKNPMGSQFPRSAEESQAVTEPISNADINERPVQNIESKIRNTPALEELREEEKPAIVEVPDKTIPVDSKIVTETINTAPSQKANDVSKKVDASKVRQSNSNEQSLPEEKADILDLPPAEEMSSTAEAEIQESIRPEDIINEAVIPASSEKPLDKKVPEPVVETAQQKDKKAPVNLMINKKEMKENATVINNNVPSETAPMAEPIIEEIETETAPSIPTEQKNNLIIAEKEEAISEAPTTVSSSEEVVVEKENASILDREPVEAAPPVLIGNESSALNDQTLNLPQLAEFLQAGQDVPNQGFVIQGIDYPKGSYLLPPANTRSLAAVLDLLKLYPDLKIEIGSHTSAIGDDVANHNLSRKRAMSIKAFLIYKGVDIDRVEAKGYGETQLTNRCANGVDCAAEEHAVNDRVEVRVLD